MAFVVNADGSGEQRLSPDGTQIVYATRWTGKAITPSNTLFSVEHPGSRASLDACTKCTSIDVR
jgi:hypothetical protein